MWDSAAVAPTGLPWAAGAKRSGAAMIGVAQ